MNQKKHKLRLRKQVIFALPIALITAILIVVLIINQNNTLKNEIISEEKMESNITENENVKPLSENRYIVDLNNRLEKRKIDNTVIYYAQKFKLNIPKTLEIAHNFTNNYQDERYNQDYVIAADKYRGRITAFNSMEAGIVYFVRDLYVYPERYGSSIEEMRLSEEPQVNTNKKNGMIIMDNGLTFQQYVGKISDLYGINKSFVLAVVYEESGIMTSGLFKYNNNISGQKSYSGWMSYPTLEAGIIGHILGLRGLSNNYGIDTNGANVALEMSGIYVHGNVNSPAYDWAGKVSFFMEQINSKDLFTIE